MTKLNVYNIEKNIFKAFESTSQNMFASIKKDKNEKKIDREIWVKKQVKRWCICTLSNHFAMHNLHSWHNTIDQFNKDCRYVQSQKFHASKLHVWLGDLEPSFSKIN